MLCASCEHRFNSHGENWTLGRLWKSPTDSSCSSYYGPRRLTLRTTSIGCIAAATWPALTSIRSSTSAQACFGRASLHGWRGGSRISLGPHSESLRRCLHGQNSFPPPGIAMHFAVSANPGKAWNRSFSLPGPCTRDGTPERYFVVEVPGARAVLVTSPREVPADVARVCIACSGYILTCEGLAAWRENAAVEVRKTSTLKGKRALGRRTFVLSKENGAGDPD